MNTACCPTNTQNQPCDEGVDIINLGAGEQLSVDFSDTEYGIKSLVAGTGISLTSDPNTVTINSTSSADSCANIGTGSSIYEDASVAPFNFRKIQAGDAIGVGIVSDSVVITSQAVNSIASTGTGTYSIISSGTPTIPVLKELNAGTNITITEVGNDLTIAASGGGSAPNYLSDSLSLKTDSVILIGKSPLVINFDTDAGFGFNNVGYTAGTFIIPNLGVYQVSFNILYQIPTPEVGQVFARINIPALDEAFFVETPLNSQITRGYLGGSRAFQMFGGTNIKIEVWATSTSTSPQVNPGSSFSVVRIF